MSKIICDICGTSYPETAKQCPICGSVQPGDVQRVTNEVKNDGKGSTGYTHVKGGHFTKSNVKKRTKDSGGTPASRKGGVTGGGHDKDNRGLVITAIVLLVAVIGVVIYIAIGFFKPYADQGDSTLPSGRIRCEDIRLEKVSYLLLEPNAMELLVAKPDPEDTTDVMTFTSLDPAIVTVDASGNIKAVGEGTTYVDIRCGAIEKRITVKVEYPANNNDSGNNGDENNNEENPNGNGGTTVELRFVQYQLKLTSKGSISTLYVGSIPKSEITWTSDNTNVATFKDGVVTAVGAGTTNVHAEYNGQKITCAVTCEFNNNGGQSGNGGVTEDGSFTQYTGKIVNVSESVNVRSSPGALGESNRAGTMALHTRVTVYEEQPFSNETWCRVSADGESPKWIRSDFIQKD